MIRRSGAEDRSRLRPDGPMAPPSALATMLARTQGRSETGG